MKERNLRIGVLITLLLVLAVAFTGCSKSVKDEALEKVKAVDLKAYMQEERDAVKEFKSAYEKYLKKAKDDKAAEKIMKQFKKDLKTFATKKEKIETKNKFFEIKSNLFIKSCEGERKWVRKRNFCICQRETRSKQESWMRKNALIMRRKYSRF